MLKSDEEASLVEGELPEVFAHPAFEGHCPLVPGFGELGGGVAIGVQGDPGLGVEGCEG